MSTCTDARPALRHAAVQRLQMRPGTLQPPALARACAYIETHLGFPLRLDRVASEAGLSPHHFSRCFTRSMGVNFVGYIALRRIETARRALDHDADTDLATLAVELGYCDQAHFSNVFRRVVGTTPKRYARQSRSQVPAPAPVPPRARTRDCTHLDRICPRGTARAVGRPPTRPDGPHRRISDAPGNTGARLLASSVNRGLPAAFPA